MLGEGAVRGIKLLFVGDDWRGTPAYQNELLKGKEVDPRFGTKIASLKFPNVQSCLVDDEATSWLIDWKKINNSRQAEVCLFRILHSANSLDEATARLTTQGLGVVEDHLTPERGPPAMNRLDGYWSIRRRGPRFDSMRVFTYFLPEFNHTMAVDSFWHEVDDRFVFVRIRYIFN